MRVVHPARRTAAPETLEVLHRGAGNWATHRAAAKAAVPWDEWRERGRAIRADAVAHLPELLDELERSVSAAGGVVHRAPDAATARAIVRGLCDGPAVKSKSMLADEIGLDVEAVETDLGEWIIQLLGDRPSHILAPAIHVSAEEVADLFSRHSGEAYDAADTRRLVGYARQVLRERFLEARVGITGVNFAVASTGTLILVESEGNIRMSSTLPRRHIALMGIEKVLRDWEAAAHMIQLLPLAAHGKPAATYTSLITGPREGGPEELHLVLVDDGRSALLGTELESALHCIRCGACLYACPVYRQIGGHAYGAAYAGPIGAVITPALEQSRPPSDELPWLSSLCGACVDACPVGIPLDDHLVRLRARGRHGRGETAFWAAWARVWSKPGGYRATALTAGKALRPKDGWMASAPLAWTDGRDVRAPASAPFHVRWRRVRGKGAGQMAMKEGESKRVDFPPVSTNRVKKPTASVDFSTRLAEVDATLHTTADLQAALAKVHELIGDRTVAVHPHPSLNAIDARRVEPVEADVSVIRAELAIEHTGQIALLNDGPAGLLPDAQIALLDRADLVPTTQDAIARLFPNGHARVHNVVLAAGPSRTADIEQTMMLGVHAPRTLDVVLYG